MRAVLSHVAVAAALVSAVLSCGSDGEPQGVANPGPGGMGTGGATGGSGGDAAGSGGTAGSLGGSGGVSGEGGTAGSAGSAGTPGAHKWNPGHYMLTWGSNQSSFSKIYGEDNFQGAQIRYEWRELEPDQDNYDFSAIESDLAVLQQNGKRLFIQLMDRRFNDPEPAVPDYLLNDPIYHGGVEPFDGKVGTVARIWDPAVLERFKALDTALGARFDAEEYFEGYVVPETAIGIDRQNTEGFSHQGYVDALKERLAHLKQAFPRTTIIIYANWLSNPSDALDQLASHCYDVGAGWGEPDIVPGGTIQGYAYHEPNAGRIPLGSSVQSPEVDGRFTPQELFDMGVQTLHLNYMFWIQAEAPNYSPGFSDEVVPYVNSRNGEINEGCPENIAPCQ